MVVFLLYVPLQSAFWYASSHRHCGQERLAQKNRKVDYFFMQQRIEMFWDKGSLSLHSADFGSDNCRSFFSQMFSILSLKLLRHYRHEIPRYCTNASVLVLHFQFFSKKHVQRRDKICCFKFKAQTCELNVKTTVLQKWHIRRFFPSDVFFFTVSPTASL